MQNTGEGADHDVVDAMPFQGRDQRPRIKHRCGSPPSCHQREPITLPAAYVDAGHVRHAYALTGHTTQRS